MKQPSSTSNSFSGPDAQINLASREVSSEVARVLHGLASRSTRLASITVLQHVENAKSCSEDVNRGTGCLGRLWLFLLEKFNVLPGDRNVDLLKGEARQQMHRVGYAKVLSC
jgi:hypothetical protein